MILKRKHSIMVTLVFLIALVLQTNVVFAQSAQVAINENATIDIISYGVNGVESFMGTDRLKAYVKFQNNTEKSIRLVYFGFEGYNADGEKILSSQHNTNDLGQTILPKGTVLIELSPPANTKDLHVKIEKYVTSDGKEYPINGEPQIVLDFASLIAEMPDSPEKQVDIKVVSSDSITITKYSSFLIEGNTPAIKVTLRNNTQASVTDVQARIKMNGTEMTYTANLQIESGQEATHSGWGLINGLKEIDIAIISYTTSSGEKCIILSDNMQWQHIHL